MFNTAIIAKTKKELQDMVNRLVETGRKYGMEINIDKSQIMRVSRSNESLQIKVNNRELKEVRINLPLFSTVVPAVVFFCPVGLSLL